MPTTSPTTAQLSLQITTHSPEETMALGARMGGLIRSNLFIALSGDLGAGKTTLTKGLAAGLGLTNTVTSPTFTLINDYWEGVGSQERRLVHVDLYRLEGGNPLELEGIGFGELLDDLESGLESGLESDLAFGREDNRAAGNSRALMVVVVEWAERLGALTPDEGVRISGVSVAEEPDARQFTLTAWGETGTALLRAMQETAA